jgi:hypothetical protein
MSEPLAIPAQEGVVCQEESCSGLRVGSGYFKYAAARLVVWEDARHVGIARRWRWLDHLGRPSHVCHALKVAGRVAA